MAHLQCRRKTRVPTWSRVPNPGARLDFYRTFRTTQTQIATLYFCTGQDSESEVRLRQCKLAAQKPLSFHAL